MAVISEKIETRIAHKCDVLVVGGGFAGIAAAISDDFTILDASDVQARLRERGVKLHECEL